MNEEEKLELEYEINKREYLLEEELKKVPTYNELLQENQQLKQQLEECQLQNCNLREDIIIKKISFQNEEIKDKSLLELYNMPSYEDLKNENQQLKSQLEQRDNIINKAREYIKDNADVYTNIMGKEVGFFKRHDDGWTPIELLEILNTDKGE